MTRAGTFALVVSSVALAGCSSGSNHASSTTTSTSTSVSTTNAEQPTPQSLRLAVRTALRSNDHLSGLVLWTNRVPRDATKSTRGIDSINSGVLDVGLVTFTLITTASAPEVSAASLLGPGGARDADRGRRLLEDTAYTSANAANELAYQAFLALEEEMRVRLVDAIVVLDGSPTIVDVTGVITSELRFASEARFRDPLVERLLGWWHRRVVTHLLAATDRIFWEEVENEIDHLRDQFKSDNLPIDVGIDDVAVDELSHDDRMFVRQLQLLAVNRPTLEIAIRDYKRAYMQRSRWLRDQLVDSSELRHYEERLIDEWQHQFAFLQQDFDESSEDGHRQVGLTVYHDLQNRDLWIRPRCQEPFVSRGSYHMLADELRLGWHPDFIARLRHLLKAQVNP